MEINSAKPQVLISILMQHVTIMNHDFFNFRGILIIRPCRRRYFSDETESFNVIVNLRSEESRFIFMKYSLEIIV